MTAVAGQRREMLLRRELSSEQQALVQQRLRGSLQRRDARSIGKSGATEGPLSFGQHKEKQHVPVHAANSKSKTANCKAQSCGVSSDLSGLHRRFPDDKL